MEVYKFIANILSERCNCQSVEKQYFIKRSLNIPELLAKASLEMHTFHMLMSGGGGGSSASEHSPLLEREEEPWHLWRVKDAPISSEIRKIISVSLQENSLAMRVRFGKLL